MATTKGRHRTQLNRTVDEQRVSTQFLSLCPSVVCLGHKIEHLCCKMIHFDFYTSSAIEGKCSLVYFGKKALLSQFFMYGQNHMKRVVVLL